MLKVYYFTCGSLLFRYATSKIASLADLDRLSQYGYRGEALASIRNLCYILEIESRSRLSRETFTKVMKKGKLVQLSNSANYRPSQGTTVTVFDLFHASPVRKKCLSECLELEWIKQRLEAFALVHPSVSFSLRNDATGSLILQTHKSSSVVGAFTHLFGVEHSQKLCTFSNQTDMFQVRGYVSRASCANRNVQFVFVNNRLVLKTKLHSLINCILSQSVILKQRQKSALVTRETAEKKCENYFRATSHPGSPQNAVDKHGIYILMITCPLTEYEITFDPTKTLVEFKHWCILLECVKNSLWECLEKEGLVEPSNLNEPAFSKQFEVVNNSELTQDTCTTNCDTSVKSYGKGIHASNISNNLQSNTVRRPVKGVISTTEGVVDPAKLIEQMETNSQHSCSHSVSCGTVPGAVLSAASDCAGDVTSKDNECSIRDNTSGMTLNARLSKAKYKKHARNNDKTSTSCVISEDNNCRSEAIFKSTSPTKLSHSDLAQHSRNNSVLECSSKSGTDNQHCQQGHPESNDAGQTQRSYKQNHERTCKITTDVSQAENRNLSFESINLTQMLESSGDPAEESSDDVIVRDHTFISLGTQNSYSSMNLLMDRGRQRSVPSTRVQIASLKMLKEQLREDLSCQSSQLSSSLRSFKRDVGTKDRHKWLAGLSHVRERLNQPHAQDRTRVSQEGKRNRESHCDGTRTEEFKRSSWQESQTSLADSIHRNQPRRELVSKHGHCECISDIPGVSRTGGITQSMCHGLPLQYPNHPTGGGTIESNDTNTEELNTRPNVHKRLASGDFISPNAKMTQYHHFTKMFTEIQVEQPSDQCVNLQALSCQRVNIHDSYCAQSHNQIGRHDSKCRHWCNQVNNLDSNSGQCNDPINRFDSDYDQCGDHINVFDFGYGQYGGQIRQNPNCGHGQVNSLHPHCAEYNGQRTATEESETSTKQLTKTDAAHHRGSFLTSADLLPGAQWISCKDTGEEVKTDTREEVRTDTREEVRRDAREEVRTDTREEVRRDTREEVRTDTREEVRRDTREEVRKDTREEVRRDTREEVSTDTREEVRRDTREEVRTDTGEEVGKDTGEVVTKDTGEEVRKDTREEVRTDTGEEVGKDTGEEVSNLGGNVEKHLAEEDHKLDISDRITNRGDQRTCSDCEKAPVRASNNIGYTSTSTLSFDSCLKDHTRKVGNTIESNNTIYVCTQGTSVVGATTNPELVPGVGLSGKTQHESTENRLVLHLTDTQDLEMTHDVKSVDDHHETAAATSSQLVPHPGLIVCNSEYDVEFVPLSVDVSDLEAASPGNQPCPTDVDMSPCVSHCSQESEGFQVSIVTDKLSPAAQQDWDPVDSIGMSMTCECPMGDMSTQPFYVTSDMTTQPFEVTHEFHMDPTKPDTGSRVTIAANSITAAQTGPDYDKVLFHFYLTL